MEDLYEYEDKSVLNESVKDVAVKSSQYHLTLLLCFFVGSFGIHRIINKKVISGVVMLVYSMISITMLIIMFVKLISSVTVYYTLFTFGNNIFVIIILAIALVPVIWRFADLIFIMTGNFKDGETKIPIKSGKPFLKTWSNYLVIGLVILQSILYAINIIAVMQV